MEKRHSEPAVSGVSKRRSATSTAWRIRWSAIWGSTERPTYDDVCSDGTGHAEVVEVTFDPAKVSFAQLLDVFWQIHDPTTPGRQGPDVGSQYRSAIFTHSDEQEATARASLATAQASGRFSRLIVTEISPAATFWRAEDYHQRYLERRGMASCHI